MSALAVVADVCEGREAAVGFDEYGALLQRVMQLELELKEKTDALVDARNVLEYYANRDHMCSVFENAQPTFYNILVSNGFVKQGVAGDGASRMVEDGMYASKILPRVEKTLQ